MNYTSGTQNTLLSVSEAPYNPMITLNYVSTYPVVIVFFSLVQNIKKQRTLLCNDIYTSLPNLVFILRFVYNAKYAG